MAGKHELNWQSATNFVFGRGRIIGNTNHEQKTILRAE